jgi:alanine racemase
VGRVTMDMLMVDVTDVKGVMIGDEAALIGRQGEERITADDMAGWLHTISYEVTCNISYRVPRVLI